MAEKTKKAKADPEESVLETIRAMPDSDRAIAERLHAVIRESAPELAPKLWYGQPAYAKSGKVVCFFRGADVDKERYLSFGFSGEAQLDEGKMWPTSYALTGLDATTEKQIAALVKKAAGG